MSDPTAFTASYNFSGWQSVNPDTPLPGTQVDIQFAAIETSTTEIVAAIQDIRRSDGALANQSVGPDQLADSLVIGFTLRGAWSDATDYSAGDGVVYGTSFYKALTTHTSSVATRPDTDDATWVFLLTFESIIVADGAITPAKLSADAAGFRSKIGLGPLAVEGTNFFAEQIAAATEKTDLADDDLFGVIDSEGFDALKSAKWSSVKNGVRTEVVDTLATTSDQNATPDSADRLVVWDSSASEWTYSLWSDLKTALITAFGALTAGLTSKSTGSNADGFAIFDSAASNVTKKMTFTNFWTNYIKARVEALPLDASNLTTGTVANDRLSGTMQNLLAPAAGSIGSYIFAYDNTNTTAAFGATRAGSTLNPTNSDDAPTGTATGAAQNGTWKCMGATDGGAGDRSITLWVRIL